MGTKQISASFCIIRVDERGVRVEFTDPDVIFWANVLLQCAIELTGDDTVKESIEYMIKDTKEFKEKVKDILKDIGGYKDAE